MRQMHIFKFAYRGGGQKVDRPEKKEKTVSLQPFVLLVPVAGLEPARF